MRSIFALLGCLTLFQFSFAQPPIQFHEDVIEDEDVYKGTYYQLSDPDNLTPIEKIMESTNFCEISGEYILVSNYATEKFEDGTIPVDEMSFERVSLLLRKDVVRYYNLQDKYNTPLKVKRFKGSEEYGSLKEGFDEERKNLLNGTYYAIEDVNSEFDLNKGVFTFSLPFNGYYNRVCLKSVDKNFDNVSFTTPQMDEDTAYKIESNPCLLVVFVKFTGETTGFDIKECVCNPLKVYIANKNTGEIYYEYSPKKEIKRTNLEPQSPTPKPTEKVEQDNEKVYQYSETQPKFPGGESALFKFVSKNLVYPKKAAKEGVQGRVVVEFVVGKDGSIKNVGILRGCNPELDKEAMRIFRLPNMPKWTPGTLNGEPVNVTFRFPITFKLQ